MKALRITLIALIIVLAAGLILAAFLPSSYNVERSLLIKAKPETISNMITDFHQWDSWSPWKGQDSAAVYTYNDTIGKGANMSWDGSIIGKGSLTITEVKPEGIVYSLRFIDPFESTSTGGFSLESSDSGTIVNWYDTGELGYPIGRLMSLIYSFDEMMGPDFEKGLGKLKEEVEKKYEYTYPILEKNVDYGIIAAIRKNITMDKIKEELGMAYGQIIEFTYKNKLTMTGPPMAISFAFDSLHWDFEAAIPVDNEVKGTELIQVKPSYKGKAIYVVYKGPYEGSVQAYYDLEAYIKEHNLEQTGGPWEVYITDPAKEPDSTQWITEIYYPVK